MPFNSMNKPMALVQCVGLQHSTTGDLSGVSILHARLIRHIAPRLAQEAWVRRHTKARQSTYTEAFDSSDDDDVYGGDDTKGPRPSQRSLRRERNKQRILVAIADGVDVRCFNHPVIVPMPAKNA